jgi:hypothetical protein
MDLLCDDSEETRDTGGSPPAARRGFASRQTPSLLLAWLPASPPERREVVRPASEEGLITSILAEP